jgi:hypothetical protein
MVYFAILSVFKLYSVEWQDGWWIRNDCEANSRGLIELLSWHLPEEMEKNYDKPQSGWLVSRSKLEPRTFRIQTYRFATAPTSSILLSPGKKVGLWDHRVVYMSMYPCVSFQLLNQVNDFDETWHEGYATGGQSTSYLQHGRLPNLWGGTTT